MVRSALQRRHHEIPERHSPPTSGVLVTLGLGVLGLGAPMAAGRLFVTGATGMAGTLGIDTYVIGALVVAVGTSLAELVTVVLSRLRGNDDIGVGTLIGSNLFNGLAIVGVAATIHPITYPCRKSPCPWFAAWLRCCVLPQTAAGLFPAALPAIVRHLRHLHLGHAGRWSLPIELIDPM